MKRRNRTQWTWPAAGMLWFLVMGWAPPLSAEITNCTPITSLPAVITTQGVYCFTDHLNTAMTSGNAIEIQVNNVTIDLNGYKLGGLAAGDGTEAVGIYANQRWNITIRNGTIRGFFEGVRLADVFPFTASQGHLVEDLLADNNTYSGLTVMGRGCRVRDNQIVDTSGSTVDANAYGMIVVGPGNDVINNRVSTTTSTSLGNAYGIYLFSADGAVVEDNRVSETADGGAFSYGIYVGTSAYVTARNNTITTADYGLYFTSSFGKYMGNLTSTIALSAFTGGTAVGTNN